MWPWNPCGAFRKANDSFWTGKIPYRFDFSLFSSRFYCFSCSFFSFVEPVLVHWTKLFWINVLLYKNKTRQGTSNYIFLFWTLLKSTHRKLFSCWWCEEDLHYGVSKFGIEITKKLGRTLVDPIISCLVEDLIHAGIGI